MQSGILHIVFDSGWGISTSQSGALLFFTLQPVGFAIEELASFVCARFVILSGDKPLRILLGYTWVVA
ncbi:hypothetical protein BDW69DRAFT_160849 [Aspergillus filifer]